jgi:hypothetical protein
VNPHTYITNNRNKVDYPAYKRRSLYIGSGPIESGNKVVVQRRCKQAGMRWNVPTAQSMLTLRAKYESGRWDSDVRRPPPQGRLIYPEFGSAPGSAEAPVALQNNPILCYTGIK